MKNLELKYFAESIPDGKSSCTPNFILISWFYNVVHMGGRLRLLLCWFPKRSEHTPLLVSLSPPLDRMSQSQMSAHGACIDFLNFHFDIVMISPQIYTEIILQFSWRFKVDFFYFMLLQGVAFIAFYSWYVKYMWASMSVCMCVHNRVSTNASWFGHPS